MTGPAAVQARLDGICGAVREKTSATGEVEAGEVRVKQATSLPSFVRLLSAGLRMSRHPVPEKRRLVLALDDAIHESLAICRKRFRKRILQVSSQSEVSSKALGCPF